MRKRRKLPGYFVFPSSHTLPFTGVQGRFLALLEMTIRGKRYSRFAAFPIGEGGPRQRWIGYCRYPHTVTNAFRLIHLSFIPPVPYPPLQDTFPSRGRLTIRGKPAIKRPSGIAPVEPSEPIEPAEPLSLAIKGRVAPGLTLKFESRDG